MTELTLRLIGRVTFVRTEPLYRSSVSGPGLGGPGLV